MSDKNETESHPQGLSVVIGILFVIPLVYVLSMGPVAAASQKTPSSVSAVRQFYFPLIWLHDHTILKKPLELYAGLWGVH